MNEMTLDQNEEAPLTYDRRGAGCGGVHREGTLQTCYGEVKKGLACIIGIMNMINPARH